MYLKISNFPLKVFYSEVLKFYCLLRIAATYRFIVNIAKIAKSDFKYLKLPF